MSSPLEVPGVDAAAGVEGLRRWRERQAVKTAGASLLVQVLGYAVRLAVIPLSIRLLGTEGYGLWLAVGSLVAWGGVAELGLSPGLLNAVATASGRGDREAARRHISTGLAAYGALAGILGATFWLVPLWGDLPRLLGVAGDFHLRQQVYVLLAICGAVFAGSLLTRTVAAVCSALQEGYLVAYGQLAGSLGALGVLLLMTPGRSSLAGYTLAVGLPPLAAQAGLGVLLFGRRHPELRPGLRFCDRQSLRVLAGFAGPLTLDQLATIAAVYSVNVLIANRLGPGAVPQFAVPYSVFLIFSTLAYQVSSAYVPAYADAAARGDFAWVRRNAARLLVATVGLMTAGCVGLLVGGPAAIRLWTGGQVAPGRPFLLALGLFAVLQVGCATSGVCLVGLGRVRGKAALSLAAAAVFLPTMWYLLPALGALAVPLAGTLSFGMTAVASVTYVLRYASRMQGAVRPPRATELVQTACDPGIWRASA